MDRIERQSQSETLSAALRLIRTHRRMRTVDIAQSMGMALRSYEHFEAGGGRVNLERIHRFAEVTDSDPYAILAALALGSPKFALRTADNKLMTILMVALQEFDEEVGDVLAELDARTIINTFTRPFKDLVPQSVRRDASGIPHRKRAVGNLRTGRNVAFSAVLEPCPLTRSVAAVPRPNCSPACPNGRARASPSPAKA